MADIRRPNINAPTTEGQLRQVKSYLYQLTNQLNFALKAVESEENKSTSPDGNKSGSQSKSESTAAQDTFYQLKNLIIKSADIVDAYYEVISKKLEGRYVAQSDFGDFLKTNKALFELSPENFTQYYDSVQQIVDKLGNLSEIRTDECYIKTGWVDEVEGEKVAGVEIGQISYDANGENKDTAFAKFTTRGLVFYAQDGETELAWIERYRLNVRDARIENSLELNGYKLDTSNGMAFKWIGGDS